MAKICFLGAAGNVTGSCYLVESENSKVLIDCGIFQERDLLDRNWSPFLFEVNKLDAVILTHGHLDHCGLLPKLVKAGFTGKIYASPATHEISNLVLEDSAKIQMEDVKFKIKRHKKEKRSVKHEPKELYTDKDVAQANQQRVNIKINDGAQVTKEIYVELTDAGHIIGSSSVKLTIKEDQKTTRILFSGDLGGNNRPIINEPSNPPETDYLVVESTYGNKSRIRNNVVEDLKNILVETFKKDGKVIIPSFAIERTQELLYHLFKLQKNGDVKAVPIYVDSPMATKAVAVFKKNKHLYDEEMQQLIESGESPFQFSNLHYTMSRDESKKINDQKGSCIIIAGSGMCTGGRIKHHLSQHISDENNCILFVGYQANGTLGRHILEGEKEIRIQGTFRKVKATVKVLNGLSAHADHDEILDWVSKLPKKPTKVFVTHGEKSASSVMMKSIVDELKFEAYTPSYNECISLS